MRTLRQLTLGLSSPLLLAATAFALDWKTTELSVATAPFQPTVDAVFEFKNSGTKPVAIRVLETNCGCLEATADAKNYAPGATGVINARFTVGDRNGTYVRTISVLTDEPGDPVRLSLQIEVPLLATVSPRSLSWQVGEAADEKTVELTPAPGLAINFDSAQSTSDDFSVRLETVTDGQHYRLHLQPHQTARPVSAAIRLFGREKSGHEVIVSAYVSVH